MRGYCRHKKEYIHTSTTTTTAIIIEKRVREGI
jgi:hypothetical protein